MDIEIDFTELSEQAKDMEQRLGELLAQVERAYEPQPPTEEETVWREPAGEEHLSPADRRRIEQLFEQAEQDRSYAYELKRMLRSGPGRFHSDYREP